MFFSVQQRLVEYKKQQKIGMDQKYRFDAFLKGFGQPRFSRMHRDT